MITQADLKNFWEQTTRQAKKVNLLTCLWFRADRADWRVMMADLYALKAGLFELNDFNIASNISKELFAAILREEFKIGTCNIST